MIGYNGYITNELSFNTNINISFNKNEIIKLSDNDQSFIQGREFRQNPLTRTQRGQPISYFYGFKVDGFYETQVEVDRLGQSNGAIGSFKYADINGDGTINQDDRTKIGSPHPDALYGFNLGFDYKNFGLTFFFDGTLENEIYNFKKYLQISTFFLVLYLQTFSTLDSRNQMQFFLFQVITLLIKKFQIPIMLKMVLI